MNTNTQKILCALKQAGDFVSGQALSERLGLSRVAVSKHVRQLREQGYCIVSQPRKGHRLEHCTDLPLPAEVGPLLETRLLGRTYRFLASVDSTNSYLAGLPQDQKQDGMVVAADMQTGGRGRMGRVWHSPPGCSLYFSVLLRPDAAPSELPQLALVVGVAVCTALERLCPDIDFGVKWPNDILIGRRKVAGILCEMEAEADAVHQVVLGVGLNVNTPRTGFPKELRSIATSLRKVLGRDTSRVAVLCAILNQLEKDYMIWQQAGLAPLLPRLQKRSVLNGLDVTIEGPRGKLKGVAEGCSPEGCLQVRLKDGLLRSVPSGEVHVHWRKKSAKAHRNGKKTS
ncbi:MAG: biotin--[acetyl-CoA-carboxylase] ligase [Kiritimatiellae bacterium]|nr:biotin--[acetyl-CoA-carboxylase] ligase [Kiritimatiellia bacterium]